MTGKVENRSLEEQLEFQGTEVQFSKFGKLKITYTRDLLLEFTEAEACRKLPDDFDLLTLSQLNGAVDRHCWEEDLAWAFMAERKRIFRNNPSALGAFPSRRWDTGFPGERWDRHLLMLSKESHSQENCSSERRGVVSQQLPQEPGYVDDVFSDQKTPKSALFKSFIQLRKSGNPYRPPHLNKKLSQPSDTSSELGVESSGSSSFSTAESDQRGLSDSTTGNDEPGYDSPLASEMIAAIDKPESEIINDNGLTYEEFWADSQLQECEEASCRENGASHEMIGASDKLELGIIDNNQPTFEDFWADILESLRQQEEAELGPTPAPDAEVDICLPDEDSLISVDYFNMLDNSDDAANSETEIVWPDEDSLISLYDMIGPYSSVPVNIEKPFFQLGNNDHMNFHTTSNYIPYIPSPNCFNCSNLLYPSHFTGTNPNDSLVQYSLFQQPYISPWQHYHPPVDMMCRNPITLNAGGFANKEASRFW